MNLTELRTDISVTMAYMATLIFLFIGFLPSVQAKNSSMLSVQQNSIYEAVASAQIDTILTKKPLLQGKPNSLKIPDISINKNIVPGDYNEQSNEWTLSPKGAHYASLSDLANNYSGNTLIYGHNNKETFGNLTNLKLGQSAFIETDNGLNFRYRFSNTKTYSPEDVSIFDYMGDPQLTILTCSGLFNENRTIYTFKLVEVQ